MKPLVCAAFISLLAGCAGTPPTQADGTTAAASTCNASTPALGTHIINHHDCSAGSASVISASGFQNAMRESNGSTGGGK